MVRLAAEKWREFVTCLALLFVLPALADETWRADNYILMIDFQNPKLSRLLVLSGESARSVPESRAVAGGNHGQEIALAMTRSALAAQRVRGLTMLAGVDSAAALNAALILLSDPVVAVREEAMHLVLEHPNADIGSAARLGRNDPSARVRELTLELTAQHRDQ